MTITDEMVAKMKRLRAKNLSYNAIAHIMGVGYYAVRARFDAGYKERMRSLTLRAHVAEQGKRCRDFAEAPKLSWETFDDWFTGSPAKGRSALERGACVVPRSDRFHLTPDEAYIDSYMQRSEGTSSSTELRCKETSDV